MPKSPDQALEDYFSDMLGDEELDSVNHHVAVEPQVSAKINVKPERAVEFDVEQDLEKKLKLERLLNSARAKLEVSVEPSVATETAVNTEIETKEATQQLSVEVAEEVEPDAEETLVSAEPESAIEFLHWCENGRPQWAQERFEVLLFSVSGLTLAVPLIALGQIQPLTDELTPLFGQADWFMGLQPSPSGEIRTVNTALFVMPERYEPAFEKSAQYVVSLSGVPWGLAVDSVNQPIVLEVDDVKWRSERSKRPWLAGTVKGHMCALLDIPQMAKMLLDADHSKGAS